MCALLCSNCLASPRPLAPPSLLVLLCNLTPCLTITDCLKVILCYAEFIVLPKRFRLPTSFCFWPSTILACSLFLISGFDFLIGFLTTTLDIPHCTSANLIPIPDPRLITGHSFATAFCCRLLLAWTLERIKVYDLSHFLVRVWLMHTPWHL